MTRWCSRRQRRRCSRPRGWVASICVARRAKSRPRMVAISRSSLDSRSASRTRRWSEDTSVFGCNQLPRDQPILLGRTEEYFVIRVGPWKFYLGLNKEGRFPRIEHVIPDFQSAQTTLELNGADAEFFVANVQRLPGGREDPSITLDLDDTIAIRAKTCDTPAPTELVLHGNRKSGANGFVCIDRHYLVRAAAMGFRCIHSFGAAQPMLAGDKSWQYLWMPLVGDG
jgi:hypothetical protein